jgi:VIT1/CCC1 family predicted Fe2+/Mn2+ transporter
LPLFRFIRRRIDPASRLGEVIFGLVMALGFTASARLGLDESDNHSLFISILGCNVAWAIVDGVMYVLTELFERGRKARLVRDVRSSPDDTVAIERIAGELDQYLDLVTSAEQRRRLYGHAAEVIRGSTERPVRVERDDVLGGVAVALIIVLATLPVVTPFLFGLETGIAVRISNAIAIAMLFLLGARWASLVGAPAWRIGTGLMCLGMVLVAITILLGG